MVKSKKPTSDPKALTRTKKPDKSAKPLKIWEKTFTGSPYEGMDPTTNPIIAAWNTASLRSILQPSVVYEGTSPLEAYVKREAPIVICINETKINEDIEGDFTDALPGYKGHFYSSTAKKGYSGVACFVKESAPLLGVTFGIQEPEADAEGRVITLEFASFFLVNAYVPNSGDGLKRLSYRVGTFDPSFREYLSGLEKAKPVILTGDLNVAHEPIDIFDSKGNLRNAGHTVEERESFGKLLGEGKIDVFRELYPERVEYTFWSTRSVEAYTKNRGWRLDYFIVSESLLPQCEAVHTRRKIRGSDHCPVALELKSGVFL